MMESIEQPIEIVPHNVEMAQDRAPSQEAKVLADATMDAAEPPENPQSIWGHRLRQNIRSRLLNRGVDLRLIEDTKTLPPQSTDHARSKNEQLPEHDDAAAGKVTEGSVPWAQDVSVWPRMLLQTIGSHKPGICKLCTRTMTNITRHHVHPKVGPNSQRQAPPGSKDCTKGDLKITVNLCRPCHSMVHHIIPNKLMSDSYYSIPLLESHPRVQAWINWVRRQRIPTPQPFNQPIKLCGDRSRKKTKTEKIKAKEEKAKSKQPATSRVLRSSTNGQTQKNEARLDRVMDKKGKAKRSMETTRNALAKLWNDCGKTVPRSFKNLPALKQKLSELAGGKSIRNKIVRKLMMSNAEYRAWYSWVFHGIEDTAMGDRQRPERRNRTSVRKGAEDTDGTLLQIKVALGKIWHDTGNDFPKVQTNQPMRAEALLDSVRASLRDAKDARTPATFTVAELQKAMQLDITYRAWFEWTWPGADWTQDGSTNVGVNAIDDQHDGNRVDQPQPGEGDRDYGTGTGSREDPIVFDLTDSDTKLGTQGEQDNVTTSPSGRVVIDLTLEDEDAMDIDQIQDSEGRGNVLPVFFFDLGNRQQSRSGDSGMTSAEA